MPLHKRHKYVLYMCVCMYYIVLYMLYIFYVWIVFMYVCMYVCIYVCMYVCMYVCVISVCVCMYVHMYVLYFMFIYVYIILYVLYILVVWHVCICIVLCVFVCSGKASICTKIINILLLIKTQEFIIWFGRCSIFNLYAISSTIIMNTTSLQEVPSNAQPFLPSQHYLTRKRLIYD
mgnify:CR=1 FL=1